MKHFLIYILISLTCLAAKAGNVARVTSYAGTVSYDSFDEALTVANGYEAAEITLFDDVITEHITNISGNITLDLNGFMFGGTCDTLLFISGSKACLTIKDDSNNGLIIHEPEHDAYTICVTKGARLNIEGGRIESEYLFDTPVSLTAVYLESNSSMNMHRGDIIVKSSLQAYGIAISSNSTADISGGKIRTTNNSVASGSYCYAIQINSGNLDISGGELQVNSPQFGNSLYVSSTNAKVTISGGRFLTTTTRESYADIKTCAKASIDISAGMFSQECNLQPFITPGKYVNILSNSDSGYAEGYRYRIGDKPETTDIARNLTNGKGYATLEDALREASEQDTVALVNDYTLTKNVTVKKNTVLLLPCDIQNTCNTKLPRSAYPHVEEYAFRTLTVADGVRIDVEGEMSVNAILSSVSGHQMHGTGAPYGGYAAVILGSGAEINVKGTLYCHGYISGKGTVTMNPASTLHETIQITDWRGGNISAELEAKMYPFNQYYVQNVEAQVIFHYGARDMMATDISFENQNHPMCDIPYITPDTAGLYRMHKGAMITRTYNASTDRIEYVLDGDVSLGNITINYEGQKISSEYYTLSLGNNVSLKVSNGKLTIPNKYAMVAGAQLTVCPDGMVNIEKDGMLYVYDRKEWGIYAIKGYVLPLEYTMSNGHDNRSVRWTTNTRGDDAASYEKVKSAAIDVQGVMKIFGQVMTTTSGADVHCTGNGVIVLCNGGVEETSDTYMCEGAVKDIATIPVRSLSHTIGTLQGDVNNDGKLTMADANIIVNHYTGNSMMSVNIAVGDINNDEKVSMADANIIVNNYIGE